jgi:hypothetical protein
MLALFPRGTVTDTGASEAWFYAYLMGWRRIAVYDGGRLDWSQDPISNPIQTGQPEEDELSRANELKP